MSNNESCSNCRYYSEVQTGKGLCRRSPPVIVDAIVEEQLKEGHVHAIEEGTRYPVATAVWWCGEWAGNE